MLHDHEHDIVAVTDHEFFLLIQTHHELAQAHGLQTAVPTVYSRVTVDDDSLGCYNERVVTIEADADFAKVGPGPVRGLVFLLDRMLVLCNVPTIDEVARNWQAYWND